MSKYKVGDIVKLRDDLEGNIRYGEIGYNKKMDRMKNKPIKLLRIDHIYDNSYEVEDETGENWFLSDEMIEGLWEECKEKQDKLKLIDVLNMIARGELKEGTKVRYEDVEYTYKKFDAEDDESEDLISDSSGSIFEDYFLTILDNEVELIEPKRNVGADKTIETTKIEELVADEINGKTYAEGISIIGSKLNEVINKVNAQTEVILEQRKDINEIKEQLDY